MKAQKLPTYEVEKIVGKRLISDKVFYNVKWVGYTNYHNSWEPI
jgi:hypothetical protein